MPTLPFPKTQAEMERYKRDPSIQLQNGHWMKTYGQQQTSQPLNAPTSAPLNTPTTMPTNQTQGGSPYVLAPQGQQFSGNVQITDTGTGTRGGVVVPPSQNTNQQPTIRPSFNQPTQATFANQTNDPVNQIAQAIAGVESSNRYDAVGPQTKGGNRAYGKYQIMDFNIGPWSREILGREVSTQEFLNNPQLQDQIATGKLQQYYNAFGNVDDVASMWFSGRPLKGNNRKDILGTTVPAYVQRVRTAMGNMPQDQGTTLANNVGTNVQNNVNSAFPGTETAKIELGDISPDITSQMFQAMFNQPTTNADIQGLTQENTQLRERFLNELLPTQEEEALKRQLVDIRSQADQERLRTQAGLFALEEQPIAMPIIGTQQEKLANQANLRLQTIASQESKLLNELGLEQESREARMQGIGTLLSFNEQDQERAFKAQQAIRQERQDLFNNLVTLDNVQQKRFNTIMDSLQGVRFDDLSTNSQMQIAQVAANAGVPIGVVAQGMKVTADQLDWERVLQEKAELRADTKLQIEMEEERRKQEEDEVALTDLGISPEAEMALNNPSILDEFTPTRRGEILTEIARAGGDAQTAAQASALRMVGNALGTIDQLEGVQGVAWRTGIGQMTGLTRFSPFNLLPGSAARQAEAFLNTLKDQLTLPNLEFARGLGRMSQEQFRTLKNASQTLDPKALSDDAFQAELDRVKDTLLEVQISMEQRGAASFTPAGDGDYENYLNIIGE